MPPKIPYLYIPVNLSEPLCHVDINKEQISVLLGCLTTQVKPELILSDETLQEMIGKQPSPPGEQYFETNAYIYDDGDTTRPLNSRASQLLMRENTRGPVLVEIRRCTNQQRAFGSKVILGFLRPEEGNLQDPEFRLARQVWKDVCAVLESRKGDVTRTHALQEID